MVEFPKIIQDGDIELVKLEPTFENAQKVFDLINKNREFIADQQDWVNQVKTIEDTFRLLIDSSNSRTYCGYFIFVNGDLVGKIIIQNVQERIRRAELGYWLGSEFTGRGIMTHAVKMIENLVFGGLGMNRLGIYMAKGNEKSAAIPQRLGYHLDGILREDFLNKGKYQDRFVYSKLKSEWLGENKNA